MLRCLSRVALLGTVLALGFGLQPMAAHAAASASTTTFDYSLTTATTIPADPTAVAAGATPSGPQVVWYTITPTSSGVAPTLIDVSPGPLVIQSSSTGFDLSTLKVVDGVVTTASSSGQPEQLLGLVFVNQAFQPGNVLNIALTFNGAVSNPPELQLTPGGTIFQGEPATTTASATTSGNGGSSSGSSSNAIPEPLSLILWSAVLVGVVARNRLLGRRQED